MGVNQGRPEFPAGARIPGNGNGGFIGNREPIREFSWKWLVLEDITLFCLILFGPGTARLLVHSHVRDNADYPFFSVPLWCRLAGDCVLKQLNNPEIYHEIVYVHRFRDPGNIFVFGREFGPTPGVAWSLGRTVTLLPRVDTLAVLLLLHYRESK